MPFLVIGTAFRTPRAMHLLTPRNSGKLFFNLAMVHDKAQIQKTTLKIEIPYDSYIADIRKGK